MAFGRLALSLCIFCMLVAFVYAPAPLKLVYRAVSTRPPTVPLSNEAREIGPTTLYSRPRVADAARRALLVWFVGGGFLFCNRRESYAFLNELHARIGDTHDILTFDYPTRFGSNVRKAFVATNEILAAYGRERAPGAYSGYAAAGMSAGVLLLGTFARKEADERLAAKLGVPRVGMRFERVVCICGLYETRFGSSLLSRLFDAYVMRGTEDPALYTAYGLPPATRVMVVGARHEYLHAQTQKFLATEPCESRLVFAKPPLQHAFALRVDTEESRRTVEQVAKFLLRADDR